MATSAWFDYNGYMANKLAQVQKADSAAGWDMVKLVKAFTDAGFVGDAGAEQHFFAHGQYEDVAPNAFFNATEYYRAKAAQVYGKDPKAVTDLEAASVQVAIKDAGMSAWSHYEQFGNTEKVNPSNSFDTEAYMNAKLTALNSVKDGKQYTLTEVYDAFKAAGLSALEHFMLYGGDPAKGEVAQKYEGKIPAEFAVPENKKVNGGGGSGETQTLTKGLDDLKGTAGNDTFMAVLDSTDITLTAGDAIDGGAGIDTLKIFGKDNLQTLTNGLVTLKNLEVVHVVGAGSAADTQLLDVSKLAGVTDVVLEKHTVNASTNTSTAGKLTVTVANQSVTLKDFILNGDNATDAYTPSDIVAIKDTTDTELDLTVSGFKSASQAHNKGLASIELSTPNAETLNLKATGGDSTFMLYHDGITELKNLNISGDAEVTMNLRNSTSSDSDGFAKLASIDASKNSAGVDLTLRVIGNELAFTGTAKDDTLNMLMGSIKDTSKVTIDMGAGDADEFVGFFNSKTDTSLLSNNASNYTLTTTAYKALNAVKGVEVLTLDCGGFAAGDTLVIDASKVAGDYKTLNVVEQMTISEISAGLKIAINTDFSSATNGEVETLKGAVGETINVEASKGKAIISNGSTFAGMNLSGTADVIFTDSNAHAYDALSSASSTNVVAMTSAVKIDATNLTGKLTIDTGDFGSSITGGAGDDYIRAGSAAATFKGNGGNDTFALQDCKASGVGTGNDFTYTSTTIQDFTKGADKIALFASNAVVSVEKYEWKTTDNLSNVLYTLANASTTQYKATWFTDGTNTYVVGQGDSSSAAISNDVIVTLNGVHDLGTTVGDVFMSGLA